jgi:2-methylisocitrate lyase-like PEP mutase family enzyme
MTADLKAHAGRLRELHHAAEMLVLPNVWDAASAKIVAEAGFPVVATASAAISAMLGYPDGEGAPWQEMFAAARMPATTLMPMIAGGHVRQENVRHPYCVSRSRQRSLNW